MNLLRIQKSVHKCPSDEELDILIAAHIAKNPKESQITLHRSPSVRSEVSALSSNVTIAATTDLGTVHFTLNITGITTPAVVVAQVYINRVYTAADGTVINEWPLITPSDTNGAIKINLFPGQNNVVTFSTSALPLGTYDQARVILFVDGSNLGTIALDSTATGIGLNVTTTQIRITAPVLLVDQENALIPGADGTVDIPYTVKFPQGFTTQYSGLFTMAKGTGGAVQPWIDISKPLTATGPDAYLYVTGTFKLPLPTSGRYNLQFGLFDYGWKMLQWVYPGLDYEVGGNAWVVQCPASKLPPRLQVVGGQWQTLDGKAYDWCSPTTLKCCDAVAFVRGGDYGNALTWSNSPDYNLPGYFSVLRFGGLRWIRTNFDADKYLQSTLYQHAVDQVVQNQLAGGLYPIIGPQAMPTSSLGENDRAVKLVALMTTLATNYKGQPVWINLCNEPNDLGAWAAVAPVMERAALAVRLVDPQALITCPFEGYSNRSTTDAAAAPLSSVHIDLYDYHAYNSPDVFRANIEPALKAGLPVIVGEYGGGDAAYMHAMNLAFQQTWSAHKNLVAVGPWAFTHLGQDSIPLVLDGTTAVVTYTDSGKAVMADFASWDAGTALVAPIAPPAPVAPPILTDDQKVLVRAIMVAALNARLGYLSDTMKNQLASATFASVADAKAFFAKMILDMHP